MDKIIDMTEMVTTDEPEVDEVDELKQQVESMTEKMNEKLELGRKSLINMIEVTRDKFRTVNGTNHIYQTMLEAKLYKNFNCKDLLRKANDMAISYSITFKQLAFEVECGEKTIENIQELIMNYFYQPEFDYVDEFYFIDSLINIQMVRELDGTCNDLLDFKKTAEEEIDKVKKKIEELENGE